MDDVTRKSIEFAFAEVEAAYDCVERNRMAVTWSRCPRNLENETKLNTNGYEKP